MFRFSKHFTGNIREQPSLQHSPMCNGLQNGTMMFRMCVHRRLFPGYFRWYTTCYWRSIYGAFFTGLLLQPSYMQAQPFWKSFSLVRLAFLVSHRITPNFFNHSNRFCSTNMQFSYLSEMKAVDGECDRQRKQTGTPEQGPKKEPPVLDAFDAADTELINGAPQG